MDASANESAPGTALYVDRSGNSPTRNGIDQERKRSQSPEPVTDFQRLAEASTGELLPLFGRNFFQDVPSTFAPGDQIAVAPDYAIGPGDEILLRIWGPETFNGQLTVDRSGSIYVPRIGAIHVAGLRFDELHKQITAEMSRTYRNFEISVNLGQLRSIQVYVVGEARHPGAYTVSSLSTVLNVLFACGGPNAQGSMRHIEVRRTDQPVAQFDLYDFILHGDKSKDIRLQTGDTIFIPATGPQIALGGSIRHPAIYELTSQSTLQQLLELAGDLSPTASADQVSLERIDTDHVRQATTVALNTSGRGMLLQDGDVIFVNHISAAYQKTVTIRGNLANPGRFAWHPGMRLSDIIPDKMALLTTGYWDARNKLGVPVPLFQSAHTVQTQNSKAGERVLNPNSDQADAGGQTNPGHQTMPLSTSLGDRSVPQANIGDSSPRRILISEPAPEIDWAYAVIERLETNDLKNTLIPFNLGRLVQDHDQSQNLELLPGDTVTIFSQNDVQVPRDMQTKYVRLEGEFVASGVYSVGPDEKLADLVGRVGGLTPNAYLYGSSFTRESARVLQQQRMDEYFASLSADVERAMATQSVSSVSGSTDLAAVSQERVLIEQLRQLRATGRVVLEFTADSTGAGVVPNIPLEDGDVFHVPATPDTVSVVGAVYGPNTFLYNPSRRLVDYVALAGQPNRIADTKHAFIIRADGSIYSREGSRKTLSNNFNDARIHPGDSIVVPEKLIKPSVLRDIVAYSQVLSSFGLAAAAISVIR